MQTTFVSKINSFFPFVLTVIFACGLASHANAQGLGTIVGTVTDPSGGVLPSVTVTATVEATGASRSTASNAQGYFVIPSLQPARYDLRFEAPGFAGYVQKGITLLADQSVTANAALKIQQANEVVTVEAAGSQVNTTTSTLSEVVDQKRIVDLPLNGRNAATLTLLVAGAVQTPTGNADQGITKTFPGAVTISTNGSRGNQISYQLDGGNNVDTYTNVNQPFPFPDALQEFSVQTSNYSARYGQNAGGVVNIITKSGTNQLHGDAFEFVRNAVFNARNFFSAKRDQLKRNQFGGTFGGPLTIPHLYNGKDKTFFFAGYQGTLIRNITGGLNSTVPTAANLSGDFSNYLTAANPLGKRTLINDPLTGQPFPNNLIPANRLDPAALALVRYLPAAGPGGGQVFYSQPVKQDFHDVVTRVDHNISTNDRLSGRYTWDRFTNGAFFDNANILSTAGGSEITSQNFLISENHVFRPNLLNDLRLNVSRVNSQSGPAAGSPNLRDLGVNIYQPNLPKTFDGVSVSGFFNVTEMTQSLFTRTNFGIADDVSWVRGRHTLSFGGSFNPGQVIIRNGFQASGKYSFTSDYTNLALASFLLGKVRTFQQGAGEFKDNRNTFAGVYFQDDFHASRRLTLNLGLRYEPFFPQREIRGRVEQFRPDAYAAGLRSTVFTNAPAGLLFPGDPGVPKYGARASYTDFAPRVGFAYDLTGDGKTSIRGGGGFFYDSSQVGVFNNRFVDVTPFSPQISLTDPQGTFSNPYLGINNIFPAPSFPAANSPFQSPVQVITYDPSNDAKLVAPVIYNWNFSIERQLPGDWLLRTAYVGSHGSHQSESIELNPATYIPGSTASTDQRRLFAGYGSIALASQDLNFHYNSLQLTAQKRLSRGFTILANYTWSKSLDTAPVGQGVAGVSAQNVSAIPWYRAGRRQFDFGRSDFDHKHRFVTSYVWDMPALARSPGLMRQAFGSWQLTGIFTYQSGGPLTILAGKDQSQTGLGTDRAQLLSSTTKGPGACNGLAPCVDFLNVSAFGLPPVGTFGNVGKGSLTGPDLMNWDMGLFKNFPIRGERYRLQFHAEFFNVFNRVNLSNPNQTVSSSGFGSIRGAGDPRIGQLALKLYF